jgi:hypothetical protein
MSLYRIGCAEPNRSVIMAEFRLPAEWRDPRNMALILPSIAAKLPNGELVPFELKAEPNGSDSSIQQQSLTKRAFGDFTGGWDDARRFIWRYYLDFGPAAVLTGPEDLASYYNEELLLDLYRDQTLIRQIRSPSTQAALQPNQDLPLNGRLGGNWVERGAVDQGFLLSFSNPVTRAGRPGTDPENSDLLVFISWFTFDSAGDMLWLTGSARFGQGATEVSVPIERVSGGAFMQNRQADRSVVGTARLKANQCNDLEFDYDLRSLGLDAGTIHLERLYSLEIAGYACRDYWARLAQAASTRH